MHEELSSRQNTILKLIVQEYVRTGRAVGSKSLIERYGLPVSPATVRNEMGELEERAYLQHPHTSAGRIPTDRGYRYYVERLLDDPTLPVADQITIRHQFLQVEMQIESWAKLAASVLADIAGNLALVTPPRSSVEKLRHFELLSLRDLVALLILVTQAGVVRETLLHLDRPVDQAELSMLSRKLNPELRNRTSTEVLERAAGSEGLAALVIRHLGEMLRLLEKETQSEVFTEGLDRTLQQPEFNRSAVAQRLLELLRGGSILTAILPELDLNEELQVIIGSEHQSEDLHPFGIVVATYGVSDEVTGILGVLGPTRMPYGRSISTVRYLAQVMTDLLDDLY